MRKSRLSSQKQHRLIEHFVAGTTARCAAELVGINRKTAAYYYHRLREIIAYKLEQESNQFLGGQIEVDESYFGGKVYTKVIPDAKGDTLLTIIKEKVIPDSIVYYRLLAWL